MQQQKQVVQRCRRELKRVNDKKQKAYDHLDKLTLHMIMLESGL